MKKILFALTIICLCIACNNEAETSATQATAQPVKKIEYPEALQKIFAHHGGLEQWKKMKSMSYEIVKEKGNEKQFIDLQNRRERIEASNFVTGYDGKNFWLEADATYKGNAIFYHNLEFYFYAMPFVVADDGIIYSTTEALEFEGKNYPGIRISYEDGIGVSPKDEYFIHYDPMTFEMTWLGYTVTYFSKKKSKKVKWIRYDDWKKFNNLLLPNSISWYKMEEGSITTLRNKVEITNVKVSTTSFEDKVFEKTEAAKILE